MSHFLRFLIVTDAKVPSELEVLESDELAFIEDDVASSSCRIFSFLSQRSAEMTCTLGEVTSRS